MEIKSICLTNKDLWLSVGGNTPFTTLGNDTITEIHLRELGADAAIILVFESGGQLIIKDQNIMIYYKPGEGGADE